MDSQHLEPVIQPRLTARLAAPVAVVSIIMIGLAFGAAWYVRWTQKNQSQLMKNNVASVHAAQELEISIREVRTQFDRYLITYERKYLTPVDRMRDRTAKALDRVEELANTQTELDLVRRIRGGYEHFFDEYEKVIANPPPDTPYLKIAELIDTVLTKEILEPAHEYLKLNEGMLTKASEENEALAARLTIGLIGLGLFGAFGGMLGGWVLAAAVRRTLQQTETQLQRAADQLAQAVPPDRRNPPSGTTGTDALQRVSESVNVVLDRLRQSEKDALRAEQLAWVGQMAAGIAHEVRNPLMAIKLLVQAAATPRGGRGFRLRDLQVLEEEIVRVEQIISSFLDFARPPRPEKRSVDVIRLAESAAEGVRPRAEVQGVEITVVAPSEPVVISADENQIRQVLYNLMFNAIDVLPDGGEVMVRANIEDGPEGAEFVLTVEDDGPGLPAGLGERIFEPFVSTKETGLGLGLSICRRIIESHNGTLSAANRPGGGAIFTVRLPAAAPEPAATTAAVS
jgi:signal transduction histidine kinase